MATSLPPEVLDLVEMSPVEDLLLALIPDRLGGVEVKTKVSTDPSYPFVLVRSNGSWGTWSGDERFLDAAHVFIQVYCDGVNSDEDAANLSEAIRVILRDSKNVVIPQRGHITSCEMVSRPRRAPDWATSTGPVQYADLPNNLCRYETEYHITIRKPAQKPFAP
jgi:hypothetical protein